MPRPAFADASVNLTLHWDERPGEPTRSAGWRLDYRDPVTRKRRRKRLPGRLTRAEAVRAAKRIVLDLENQRTSEWRATTFRELCDAYLADPRHQWPPNTRRGQAAKLRQLCNVGMLGDQQLGELVHDGHRLDQAMDKLALYVSPRTKRPYARGTLRGHRDALGTVVSWAQSSRAKPHLRIPRELAPMKGVKVPPATLGAKGTTPGVAARDVASGSSLLITPAEIPSWTNALALG